MRKKKKRSKYIKKLPDAPKEQLKILHESSKCYPMEKSLFERLGGSEGITHIVDDAIENHMNNPAVSPRFMVYRDMPERLAEIKKHSVNFFSAGSGGPANYTGREMPEAHKGMNISPAEYMHVVDDICVALDKHQIDSETQKEVLSILWSLKEQIIGQ